MDAIIAVHNAGGEKLQMIVQCRCVCISKPPPKDATKIIAAAAAEED